MGTRSDWLSGQMRAGDYLTGEQAALYVIALALIELVDILEESEEEEDAD